MRRLIIAFLAIIAVVRPDLAQASLDPLEASIIATVARDYGLTPWQIRLLKAIRQAENGGPGREFGVLVPEAMRFKHDPERSLVIQAKWAAGSIKKRCPDESYLEAFAERWAPTKNATNDPTGLNKHWLKNVRYFLSKTA